MSGISTFSTPMQIWRNSWIWFQQAFFFEKLLWYEYKSNITRPRKLKTLFFMWMSKNLSAIFSLNVYSVYGSQQKEKREVIKIFLELNYKWERCSRNHLCITRSLWCWHTVPQDLLLGFWTKAVNWKNKPVCGSNFVMSMHWTGSDQDGTAFFCSKWQNLKQLVGAKKKKGRKKKEIRKISCKH